MPHKTNLNLVAYCGLYCPKCYKMKVADAADSLNNELEIAQTKGAKFLENYSSLKQILNDLSDLHCVKFCRKGGGKSSVCVIKKCCDNHDINGCWECIDFNNCKILKKQFIDNITKIKKNGIENYIKSNSVE